MEYQLDIQGRGYDIYRELANPSRSDHWALVCNAVVHARSGNRELLHQVPEAIINSQQEYDLFSSTGCNVVGDGGNAADLEVLVNALPKARFEFGYDIARALSMRGRLVDVPAIFSFYERFRDVKDAHSAALWLPWLLETYNDEWAFPMPYGSGGIPWPEYRRYVGVRYFELWSEFGTNLVHVHRGQKFELQQFAKRLLQDARAGSVSIYDCQVFEANTGWSCAKWYTSTGGTAYLEIAADLEEFLENYNQPARPGQRSFMGHPLEDVAAAEAVLARYPSNGGMGVPEIRTTFDHDDGYFKMEFGFEGYFCHSPLVPPTAQIPVGDDWPWLTFQICLREVKLGNRDVLTRLASLVKPVAEFDMFPLAAITVLADAADDIVIAPWRKLIQESNNSDFIFELCCGLLRRGMLRDVPLVLAAYQRIQDNPDSKYLQQLFNELFPFAPILENKHIEVSSFCEMITARADALAAKLGGTDFPIFRGSLATTQAVAREVIDLQFGSRVTWDLKDRFERTTGIDCSDWEVIGGTFDATIAAKTAQRFLDSGGGEQETPGELYFFGHPIEVR